MFAPAASYAKRSATSGVVTGQKVWNSGADSADLGMLLARTDPGVPKHRGMTYFVIEMHQPGVEVRPPKQTNGASNFCEVFLTEARVRAGCTIGAVNGGWRVAQTTLIHERNSAARGLTRRAGRWGAGLRRRECCRGSSECFFGCSSPRQGWTGRRCARFFRRSGREVVEPDSRRHRHFAPCCGVGGRERRPAN
jgi:hypothetical protein